MASISRTPSIYQIRHIESGKVYVGSATNPKNRWRRHQSDLRGGIHHSRYLQRAWNKYGELAFIFEIIEPVLFVEDLIAREQYWIDTLQAANLEHGYNTSPTAGSCLGAKQTMATRAKKKIHWTDLEKRSKMAESARKRMSDPKVRKEMSERTKKQLADPAVRAKMSADGKARFANPAERAKLAAQAKARLADPAERKRLSEQSKAAAANPETRARIAKSAKAHWSNPVVRAEQSARIRAQWEDPNFRARQMEIRKQRSKNQGSNPKRNPSDTRINRGESNGSSRFTTEQVLEMRRRYDNREATAREMAQEVGSSEDYIRAIVHRLVWKHLP